MHKVITLCNQSYFQHGKPFLETRHKIHADFICYGPDLTHGQQVELAHYDIEHKKVSRRKFDLKMQALKFELLFRENDKSRDGLTFVDFDTYFVDDWHDDVFRHKFDIGITVRNHYIKAEKCRRAYSNGGVIFAKSTLKSKKLLCIAMETIEDGYSVKVPEYQYIWRDEFEGSPKRKKFDRHNHRWWVDQVFLSALVERKVNFDNSQLSSELYHNYDVQLFDCNKYNRLNARYGIDNSGFYIGHRKGVGGDVL